MNLNEAAEIVRDRVKTTGVNFGTLDTAKAVLVATMLSELDPTPISEELLLANGWVEVVKGLWSTTGDLVLCRQSRNPDCWKMSGYAHAIKTLGELRTLLRLMGGGE